MRQSKLFTKTRKEAPKDEVSLNARLLIRAGFINKEMAGVYSILPLGLRVINKIANIVREEMNATGGVELQSTALQKQEVWEKTNRWSDAVVDNWFKTKLKNGSELALAFTHEEPMANMMKNFISSHKDLPVYVYDIRTVFRNEARAKSGIMRGREFFWKALYSFSKDEMEHNEYYEKSKIAYKNVFDRVGLGEKTFMTFASGGSFSKYSHEFQTVSEAGEDLIYIDEEKNIAVNKEVYNDEVLKDLGLDKNKLIEKKAIEVGNIFSLGHRFSEPFDLKYKDEKGEEQFVFMGSYGIGISRLMGVVVESYNDEKGIIWPEAVAPFVVHLISLNQDEEAEKIYNILREKGIEVLFDDRDVRAGEKFADSDLIGIPWRIVVSGKSLEKGGVEIKRRNSQESEIVEIEKLVEILENK
ncbi:MAG: Prolyl-tRNA synthetase [Candidatus Moranbacteria bacterium GW2011_GWE2_35_2-]|nr:MAG: Prolyl-tRNA synthetase [Candidatus Moranbacteria bacterium GW2011_GWE2_35_2-]KKQ21817.1 MAG: Prolyl-tRNA synthetase [Candidatus Moranbacteria bacterium GW2011_GWF2_37_11]KKQ28868.1 MAG: Prolyl-tRNA synthetase [Candidatus Moranbacteria bacterium GW2011_GWD1_37_17]KKQ31055.1 MAG: Prolyl-tRNA synthetase [Candidatus Moranbacteria bacterium GW2011_GWE1_37_24]KKQ48118.1 MAG: Prolyl-tRNA synthetase [Candidatus Moranbacteria bacterium GW2011_GWD2_37_9]HBO16747.1 prolyl-tRNA synthetase [Candida